jgi:O-antigen/teichoic acid export membrane protein
LFIAWRFGDVDAGLYGAAADVVKQIILIPAGSVAAAAFPLTVRTFAKGDAAETRRQLERTGELLFAVLAPAAVGLALTAPYLVSFLLGPAFRETAATIMPILAFAWLFQSISQTYIHVSFHLAMRQDLAIPHGLATLAVNAALLWPMTSIFGPTGAAWSLLASEGLGAAAGWALTWKAHRLPTVFAPGRRIALASAAMALCVVGLEWRLPTYSAGGFVALALVGGIVYAAVAVMLNVCGSRAFVVQGIHVAAARLAPKRSAAGRI